MPLSEGQSAGGRAAYIAQPKSQSELSFNFISFRQHMTERNSGQSTSGIENVAIFVILSHDSTRSHFVHTGASLTNQV